MTTNTVLDATYTAAYPLSNLLPSLSTAGYLATAVGVLGGLGYAAIKHLGDSFAEDVIKATSSDSTKIKNQNPANTSLTEQIANHPLAGNHLAGKKVVVQKQEMTPEVAPVTNSSEEVQSVGAEIASVLASYGLTELNDATKQVKEIGLNFAVIKEYPKAMFLFGKSAVFSVGRTLINLAKSILTFVDVRKVFNKTWLADNFASTKKVANSITSVVTSALGALQPHIGSLAARAQISLVS